MADPLSIAGSVVGITAAGVQASVKLYALAEKVATASQRVTSIADDISSTCAILNQVRELIIPQPDAQGTLKSVFNSVALNDISHALRRCRSSFTDIEALLRRAFEQVGKRPALHSKIKLSRFEQAKWPFLQPQFDELRNDLRDAKSNLVLMIAVASLALAQRGGRQRPIHEMERLELGSTIVQLQRASAVKAQSQNSSKSPRSEEQDSQGLSSSGTDTEEIVSTRQIPMFEIANSTKALPPSPPALEKFTSPSSNRGRVISLPSTSIGIANVSLASIGDTQVRAAEIPNIPHPSLEPSEDVRISPPQRIGQWGRQARAQAPSILQKSRPSDQPARSEPRSSNPSFESTGAAQRYEEQQQGATAAGNYNVIFYYEGWSTTHLQGLATGRRDSLSLSRMELPQKSLETLAKAYTDEGNDPHIAMSELTIEQRTMIKETFSQSLARTEPEVVYIRLQRNVTVSSVFGPLSIETLKWIVKSKLLPRNVIKASRQRSGPGSLSDLFTTHDVPSSRMASRPSGEGMGLPSFHKRAKDVDIAPLAPRDARRSSEPGAYDPEMLSESSYTLHSFPPVDAAHPNMGYSSAKKPIHPTVTMADADDESDDELDGVVEPSSSPAPRGGGMFSRGSREYQTYEPGMTQLPSQPAEENGEDIVNELLARWTVS